MNPGNPVNRISPPAMAAAVYGAAYFTTSRSLPVSTS